MTALIVMVWILGLAIWAVRGVGGSADSETTSTVKPRDAVSRRRGSSGGQGIEALLSDCDPVWSALDDRQLERLLRDAAS